MNYNFSNLSNDLRDGREIEFEINRKKYSITNSIDGYWYLYCDTDNTELMKICEYGDKKKLVEEVAKYEIDSISIKEIFNSTYYDSSTLCILW